MGQAWTGTPGRQTGMASNFNPEVESLFSKYIQGGPGGGQGIAQNPLYQQASQATQQNLGQFNPQQFEQLFQQGIANPTIRNYEQQVLPAIQNRFSDQSNLYGSGLNQALNQSAQELTGGLGELRARHQGQAYESHQNRQLQSIMQALGLAQAPGQESQQFYNQAFGTKSHTPIVQGPQSGWAKDATQLAVQLIGALVPFGGGASGQLGGPNVQQDMAAGRANWNPPTGY